MDFVGEEQVFLFSLKNVVEQYVKYAQKSYFGLVMQRRKGEGQARTEVRVSILN